MKLFFQLLRNAVFVATFTAFMGCDSSSTISDLPVEEEPPVEEELPVLEANPSGLVSNGVARIELQGDGSLQRGKWVGEIPESRFNNLWGFTIGGIWIANSMSPTRATASGMVPRAIADLEFWNTSSDSSNMFLIEGEIEEQRYENWPTWLGAPSFEDGALKRYGNSMAWSAFRPKSDGQNAAPLENIRIGVTAFVANEAGFEDAMFLRYDVTNIGGGEPVELSVGHYSDLDVSPSSPVRDVCGFSSWDNQAAFDVQRGFAFVYLMPDPSDINQSPECYGYAVGIGFLDLSDGNVPAGVFANRIMTRIGGSQYYDSFASSMIYTAQDVQNALLGLDVNGSPMINPLTNQTTKLAFTGDPISKTGWISERNDFRQLLSKPSFILGVDETKSMLVVVLRGEGGDYGEAITNLKEKYDLVKQTKGMWDY